MQMDITRDELIEQRVDHIMLIMRRVLRTLAILAVVALLLILVMEIKREFQIDIFKGVNFTIDDWYFENVAQGSTNP